MRKRNLRSCSDFDPNSFRLRPLRVETGQYQATEAEAHGGRATARHAAPGAVARSVGEGAGVTDEADETLTLRLTMIGGQR